MEVALDLVQLDGGTQSRAVVDQHVTTDYASAMSDGATFPPIVLFHDGAAYWLADGFHRYHAAYMLAWKTIPADVRQGTRRDAVLFSVGANAVHGLRRTNADKRRAVETLVNDEEWGKWSNREIARRCAVDDTTVAAARAALSAGIPQIAPRLVERNGTTYEMAPRQAAPAPVPMDRDLDGPIVATPDDAATLAFLAGNTKRREPSPLAVLTSSETNEWYTPADVIEAAREVMGGIDLDPASCAEANAVVRASRYFTAAEDGSAQDWDGRVWLNPPYGKDDGDSNQAKWSALLVERHMAGDVPEAVLLVNAFTGNAWFQRLWDFPVCFPRRLKFRAAGGEAGNAPTHGNAIVYLGPNRRKFAEVFERLGVVAARRDLPFDGEPDMGLDPDQAEHALDTVRAVEPGFDAWYDLYPGYRKVRPLALRAYRLALKKPGVSPQRLLAAVKLWIAQHPDWREDKGIPAPAVWLNQQRWEWEPPATIRTAGSYGVSDDAIDGFLAQYVANDEEGIDCDAERVG